MLIGIEFKRKKVFLLEENRTVWFWRVAPYVKGMDQEKFMVLFIAVVMMLGVFIIGAIVDSKVGAP